MGVPNIDNYGRGQLQNVHVFYFSPRTLKHYMQACGLNLIEFGPAQTIHMYGIFEEGTKNFSLDDLKEEYNLIMRKVRKGKFKDKIFKVMKALGLKF